MDKISEYWKRVQSSLFGHLEECLPLLTEKHRQLAAILELIRIEDHISSGWMQRLGRKPHGRKAMARAFIAKCVYNIPTTKDLLDRLRSDMSLKQLCGWSPGAKIPSEATFSRAFTEFAQSGVTDRIHEELVKEYLGDVLVWHISRDSTAIEAREKATPKPEKPKKKRGRPGKNDPPAEPKRMFVQLTQSASEAIADLPKACDVGVKPDSSGQRRPWVGYKLHVDIADCGIPIAAVTTSASVHDSQVAIPLAKMSATRVRSLYDLMDSAYDAQTIREVSEILGHVPIIDPAPLPKVKKPPLEPDRARRYKNRTTAERFNSHFKDNRGGRTLRVRTYPKVHAHLMFGVLVIFAEAIIGLLT